MCALVANNARGVGLRSQHLVQLSQGGRRSDIDFLELAPENWMGVGGQRRAYLEQIAQMYPLVAHGLSLSIGDTEPLNMVFLKQVKEFLDEHGIAIYSEHLSLSRDVRGYMYELIPTPRHRENISYLADRVRRVQDVIERPLVLENITYYCGYPDEMPEGAFLAELVERSGCKLLLDINNLYVNSRNHGFDPAQVARDIPGKAICYYHVAGHSCADDGLLIDTHGRDVADDVAALAKDIFLLHGSRPLLLERDNCIPSLGQLCMELTDICEQIAC